MLFIKSSSEGAECSDSQEQYDMLVLFVKKYSARLPAPANLLARPGGVTHLDYWDGEG
jgi:hypothetical protein